MSSVLVQKVWSTLWSAGSVSRFRLHVSHVSHQVNHVASEEQRIYDEPYVIFQNWLMAAQREAPQVRPRLACMATVDKSGEPVTRLTSIEEVSANGITFFTTLGSRQAGEISANPHVSLHFNWAPLMRSVRIAGSAHQLTEEQALDQFRRYPRHVQMGITHGPRYAAADWQSRSGLFARIVQRLNTWLGKQPEEIQMPPNWGGYLLTPSLFEFGMLSGQKAGRTRVRFRRCLEMPRGTRVGNIQAERQDWVYDSCEEN
ncbi:pyridoxine/pyridoxamine 5'-phosphate oxidase [Drosophila subpulchrella]|uniref:pyridoxine/pyridoxamine 5'-phosphate oxidase n=1 Tax=Drosophila subpulchrella TaxID=1486046 RepID=UPI0018A12D64|nr:pyridoxine/pyridoxamine 5'-phosphate oxidase [Drosophila subpulchrella]